MVRVLLGAAVCVAVSLVGFWLRRRYLARAALYSDWQSFLVEVGEQIGYLLTPLPQIVRGYCEGHLGALSTALTNDRAPDCLRAEEWNDLKKVLDDLGDSDLEGQRSHLSLALSSAEEKARKARDEVGSKGNLYAKLCVILGLALWLLML